MQEKHKTLGCTLVVTQHHLITLREDFSAPLKQIKLHTADTENTQNVASCGKDFPARVNDEYSLTAGETGSMVRNFYSKSHVHLLVVTISLESLRRYTQD